MSSRKPITGITFPKDGKYYFFTLRDKAVTPEKIEVITGEVQIKNVQFVFQYRFGICGADKCSGSSTAVAQ